ncbi:TIGR04222 domain-containing membrane protein [Asanoa sp. WMMD1127]|uniref:TIGR04222 domain-containing membrane protein n=1 Tax=Asanoa sp. WMMD1127 TaxID=3016107 RepID=UPI0024179C4D|nr:TIGR04222 domain-containing membrane protein [Asanoa sp. WMMD1127]MDG4826789.1 TIGR04222 domain-containing membrane protein [Asanoa sp. WMMD1127]
MTHLRYLGAAVAAIVLTKLVRVVVGQGRLTRPGPSHPQQVGYLRDGVSAAVYATLAGLRQAGAIGAGPETRLHRTGPLPAGATPLDAAVHHAAAGGPRVRNVGAARLWTDRSDGLTFLVVASLVWMTFSLFRPLGRTRAGDRLLDRLRREHAYLAPSQTPSYATYGPAGAALAVALFGLAALVHLDPAFATEAELQALARKPEDGGSCGGGGGGCGGGDCGGCGD